MKRILVLILAALQLPALAQDLESALVPMPREVSCPGGKPFIVADAGPVQLDGEGLEFAAGQLRSSLSRHFGYSGSGRAELRLSIDPSLGGNEHYTIKVDRKGMQICGASARAVLHGVRTMEQVFIGDRLSTLQGRIAPLLIDDEPILPFRAVMLDPARHFLPAKDVCFFIDQIARFKFNVLQLHLTDDQGWRFPVGSHPELTAGQPHYTRAELEEIVAYAAERGIDVLPEFDMPGHSCSLLAAHPELACTCKAGSDMSIGHGNLMLCASLDGVYEIYDDVLREAAEVFPYGFVHLGGDESAIETNWGACDRCKALAKKLELNQTEQLMLPFFSCILEKVRSLGKKAILWAELGQSRYSARLLFSYPEDVVLVSWRRFLGELCMDLAEQNGNEVIMAPSDHCYLDFPQYKGDLPEYGNWGMPVTTLRQAYRFDPYCGKARNGLKGIMCALWGEAMEDMNRVCYMAFPRALAMAEAGWTPMARRSWDSFRQRVMPNLDALTRSGVPVRAPFDAALPDNGEWDLVWTEDFNGRALNSTKWFKVQKGVVDWDNTVSDEPDLVSLEDGCLVLKGRRDHSVKDSIVYVTGAVQSRGKASFKLAKFEIRAKFNDCQGFWPAIWLMPDKKSPWPDTGEIDIMEHLNSDSYVYQTVHSLYTVGSVGRDGNTENPVSSVTSPINVGEFNVYGVEIRHNRVDFFINGIKTTSYPRLEGAEGQFPFADNPFYIILSNQLGGRWVGTVDLGEDGVSELRVDWVKVYQHI